MPRAERLLNLMIYLLEARRPLAAGDIRRDVEGYDPDAADPAFERMFERDKDDLRAAGVPITVEQDARGASTYRVDRRAYHLPPLALTAAEVAAAGLAAGVLSADPGFPMAEDLRMAFLKLSSRMPESEAADGRLAIRLLPDAGASAEADAASVLMRAVRARKHVSFEYWPLATSGPTERTVDPYGLYFSHGSWYLVGRDHARDAVRTFRLSRLAGVVRQNTARPHKHDYEAPAEFDIRSYEGKPWELGAGRLGARIRFAPHIAWLVERQVAGSGAYSYESDGSGILEVDHADSDQLVRWVLGFGASAEVLEPAHLRADLAATLCSLAESAARHEAGG